MKKTSVLLFSSLYVLTAGVSLAETRIDVSSPNAGGVTYRVEGSQIVLTKAGERYTLSGSVVNVGVRCDADCTVVLTNVAINTSVAGCVPININGHKCAITLVDGTVNSFRSSSSAPILVNAGSQVTINGTGTLNVTENGASAAAIGSSFGMDAGTIIIDSGRVIASVEGMEWGHAGASGAAIGGGGWGNGGTLVVNGGFVKAVATHWSPAIGGGGNYQNTILKGMTGTVIINGGTVLAYGGFDGGAAIGGGHSSNSSVGGSGGGTVTINGGFVYAVAGDANNSAAQAVACIGGGNYAASGAGQSGPGAAVTIDVAATVVLNVNNITRQVNVPIGASSNVHKGSLTITNKKGLTGRKWFLTSTGGDVFNTSGLTVTYADGVTAAMCVSKSGAGMAAAATPVYDTQFSATSEAFPASWVNSVMPLSDSAIYTANGGIITLADASVAYEIVGLPDFASANRIVAGANVSATFENVGITVPTNAPPVDANGHALAITLAAGTTNVLTAPTRYAALQVNTPGSVTIGGAGKLTAVSGIGGAGIGSTRGYDAGAITINGGDITATAIYIDEAGNYESGNSGAGIGSGYQGNSTSITINGGTVRASAGSWGAGIGIGSNYRGSNAKTNGTVVITGGTVIARGGQDGGAGIGGGHASTVAGVAASNGGTVRILGGDVTAIAGPATHDSGQLVAAIGGGNFGGTGGDVTIDVAAKVTLDTNRGNSNYANVDIGSAASDTKGTLTFTNAQGIDGPTVFLSASATNVLARATLDSTLALGSHLLLNLSGSSTSGRYRYSTKDAIFVGADALTAGGEGYTVDGGVITFTDSTKEYILSGNLGGSVVVKAGADVSVTFAGLSGASFDVNGHAVDITLEEGTTSTLRGAAGAASLQVNTPGSVTIQGAGTLTATSGTGGAGIGSARGYDAGSITINSGTITAVGYTDNNAGVCGAGIGSGHQGNTTYITINGGNVTAYSTPTWAAGIGLGSNYQGAAVKTNGTVTITGGTVYARGGIDGGAGIGGGHASTVAGVAASAGGTVRILGGTVTAVAGAARYSSAMRVAAIGGGNFGGAGADVTIDAAATVILDTNASNSNYANAELGASPALPGTLRLTNESGVTGPRTFLASTANDVLSISGLTVTYSALAASDILTGSNGSGFTYLLKNDNSYPVWTGASLTSSAWTDTANWSGTLGAVNGTVVMDGTARMDGNVNLDSCEITNLWFGPTVGAYIFGGNALTLHNVSGTKTAQTFNTAVTAPDDLDLKAGAGMTFNGPVRVARDVIIDSGTPAFNGGLLAQGNLIQNATQAYITGTGTNVFRGSLVFPTVGGYLSGTNFFNGGISAITGGGVTVRDGLASFGAISMPKGTVVSVNKGAGCRTASLYLGEGGTVQFDGTMVVDGAMGLSLYLNIKGSGTLTAGSFTCDGYASPQFYTTGVIRLRDGMNGVATWLVMRGSTAFAPTDRDWSSPFGFVFPHDMGGAASVIFDTADTNGVGRTITLTGEIRTDTKTYANTSAVIKQGAGTLVLANSANAGMSSARAPLRVVQGTVELRQPVPAMPVTVFKDAVLRVSTDSEKDTLGSLVLNSGSMVSLATNAAARIPALSFGTAGSAATLAYDVGNDGATCGTIAMTNAVDVSSFDVLLDLPVKPAVNASYALLTAPTITGSLKSLTVTEYESVKWYATVNSDADGQTLYVKRSTGLKVFLR